MDNKKEIEFRIRRHERNKQNKVGRTERHIGKLTQYDKNGNILLKRTLIQSKERAEHEQRAHDREHSKQLAIEEANRKANKPSNGIKVYLDSQARRKAAIELKAARRKAAILKHSVEILLN